MAVDIAALKIEIDTDPNSLGYKTGGAGTYKDDVVIASILNASRAGVSVFKGRINTDELLASVDKTEYTALSAADKQLLQILISAGTVDTTNAAIRTMLGSIFAAGSASRAAMIAAASRQGSRAEQLWGTGTVVSASDVAKALRG